MSSKAFTFTLVACSLFLSACGGGGGGNPEVELRAIEGIVVSSSNGAGLPTVEIRLVGTSDYAITTEDGVFVFDTERIVSFYELDVAGYSFASRVSLLNVPPLAEKLFVRLRMDIARQNVRLLEATATLLDGRLVPVEFED